MARIMMNEGSMVPNAVIILPRIPLNLYPMNIEIFTARIPGADCEMANNPFSFGYDFVFYKWHHRITATDCKGTYFKKDTE